MEKPQRNVWKMLSHLLVCIWSTLIILSGFEKIISNVEFLFFFIIINFINPCGPQVSLIFQSEEFIELPGSNLKKKVFCHRFYFLVMKQPPFNL